MNSFKNHVITINKELKIVIHGIPLDTEYTINNLIQSKIAVGSGLAGIASPYVFGSDPSKIDELYGDEVYAEDAGMSNWNPYP